MKNFLQSSKTFYSYSKKKFFNLYIQEKVAFNRTIESQK